MSYKVGKGIPWLPGVGGYVPDQVLGSESPNTAYAGENVIFEGRDHVNAARNPLDIAMSGATSTLAHDVALVSGSETANVALGSLLADCVPYQHFEANGLLFCINELISNTQAKIGPKPSASYTGAMKLVPNLHALDNKRATMLGGNVVKYLQCLWAVGRGVVRVDGAAISDSLTATSQPKVAYAETNTSYDVREVGFTRPSAPTVTAVSGGAKAMPAGYLRSVRFSKKRVGELGYGPASEPVIVDMSGAADQMMHATLAAYDTGEGQNRWLVWVTKDEVSTAQGGPWFEYGEIDADGTTFDIEYRSGELGANYVDDYTRKPDPAVCVAAAGDLLMWGGALAVDASGNPTVPGDIILVSSPTNVEGYPGDAETGMANGESIITIKVGKVQLYAFAANSVQYALLTQGTKEPLALLPYLQTGIRHQYNACIGGDVLVIFTDGKLVAFYDRSNAVEPILFRLANDCATLLKSFPAERTFVGYDPANERFVVFCSNYRQHADGGWQTIALSFDMRVGRTNTPVFLGNGTDNFTVSGCATISNHLEFVTTDGKIWRWEQGSGNVSGWLASPFTNFGSNLERCTIRRVVVTGNLDGAVSIVSNLDDAKLNEAEITGVPTKTLANPSFARTRFPVWSPNTQGENHAIRVDFTVASGGRVLDNIEVGAVKRDGAEN